jgi:hypothetical protein
MTVCGFLAGSSRLLAFRFRVPLALYGKSKAWLLRKQKQKHNDLLHVCIVNFNYDMIVPMVQRISDYISIINLIKTTSR